MHCRVRNYLRIEQDVTINFECAYSDNNSLNLSKSTTVPPRKAGPKEAKHTDKRSNVIYEDNNNSLNLRRDTAVQPAKAGAKDMGTTAKGLDAMDDDNQQITLSRQDKLDILSRTVSVELVT